MLSSRRWIEIVAQRYCTSPAYKENLTVNELEPTFVRHATAVRQALETQYLSDADVTFIDVGLWQESEDAPERIAVRIHVKDRWFAAAPDKRTAFPNQVRGVPVVIVRGEIRPE